MNISILPHGYVNELAKLCDCSRATVYNALRKNAKGKTANKVRKAFHSIYINKATENDKATIKKIESKTLSDQKKI